MAQVMAATDISAKVSEQLTDARGRSPLRVTASLAIPQPPIAATEESHTAKPSGADRGVSGVAGVC